MTTFAEIFSVSRPTDGWTRNKAGVYVRASANVLARTDRGVSIFQALPNQIGNPNFVGAASGTPGTAPTNSFVVDVAGMSRQMTLSTDTDGIPVLSLRLWGTASGSGALGGAVSFGPMIAAASGDTVTFQGDCWYSVASGAAPTIRMAVQGYQANQNTLTDFVFPAITNTKGVFSRAVYFPAGLTAYAMPQLRWIVTGGLTYDFTVSIKAPFLTKNGIVPDFPVLPPAGQMGPFTKSADNVTALMGTGSGPFPGWGEINGPSGFSFAGAVNYDALDLTRERTIVELSNGTAANSVRLFMGTDQRLALEARSSGMPTVRATCPTPLAAAGRQAFGVNVKPSGMTLVQNIGLMEIASSGPIAMPNLSTPVRIGSGADGKYLNAVLETIYFGDSTTPAALANFAARG